MEAKGKQAFLALEPLEADRKLALGDGEGVTQVFYSALADSNQ